MVFLFDDVPIKEYFKKLFNFYVDFQAQNPKYRCIFGKVHVLNAAKVLLLLEIFLIIPLYILFLFPWWLMWIGFHLVLILITIYALRKKKHRFMWPMVLFTLTQFFFWGILTLLQLLIAFFDTQSFLNFYSQGHHEEFFEKALVVIVVKLIVLLIGAILFWRLSVFYAVKNYFSDRLEGQVSATEESKGLEGVAQKLLQPV
ncbi:hypothetical protein GCK72_000921 [Caenorhabditis remanei]|uniref:Uncharacterized protein n=1 Tax=Caenorhabditis remanei TaxID=31234 RepID=A0A6A5HMH6_CAERE|nr:hypothetical protein GCK72_000921 [Caenorhabditis remanei]KAF1769108.1 hypothetical protein GCK72_000921 [Caenorhabditis remanei]